MSALQTWQTFLSHSLATRLELDPFTTYVRILSTQARLPSEIIADLFLRPTEENQASLDPRVPRYVQILLAEGFVTVPSVLRALCRWSYLGAPSSNAVNDNADSNDGLGEDKMDETVRRKRWTNSCAAEELLFYRLAKSVSSASSPKDSQEAVELLLVVMQWMVMVCEAMGDELLNLAGTHTAEITSQNIALGTLVVAIVENGSVQRSLGKANAPKGTCKELGKRLANFVPLLVQSSPQSAARLELFRTQTLPAIEPEGRKGKGESEAAGQEINEMLDYLEQGIDSIDVQDLPIVNSRAGLYIYLNSLLVGRPLIDDNAIFTYLHNRYQGDIQTTIVDLILAGFDILANATFRNERPQTTTLLRSFLINKIPLILHTLSSSLFPPLTAEYCITSALNQVDTNAFPTLSSMFDESSSSNMFSDSVRQDFCFACCLHGLISEGSIETLLGDIPMQSLPAGGRYVKSDLVAQFTEEIGRAEAFVDELEHMDGNVGAVSQAITEVIARLCNNKETMSLKSLCAHLARRPASLDVMLLFERPSTILQPLCELLDNWRYDEDQGEYQPVYEEFGSILLLVLSFTNRYNLSKVDLGIRSTSDSFIAKLLNQGHLSRAMEELTQQEQSHLDGWIRGLFDNESGGLGDELMSSCPPQDFYLLVPTLFHHIVLAYSTKNLSDDSLKGGLEYLVDTFLLPSLIPGITWLGSHLWESRGDANAVLQVLSALITDPNSISKNTEASQMLNSILNIVSKNLEYSLRWLQRAEPSRQDVEPLSKLLRSNLGWERRGASEHTELEAWTATPSGGLAISIKQTIVSLVQWALSPEGVHPSNFSHRQILVACKILGAKRLLNVIIDEVKSQTEAANGSVVLDVACAVICAPEAASWGESINAGILGGDNQGLNPIQRRLTLREALKNEVETMPKVHKTDPFTAETVIRLYRKVEAQLQMPELSHDALQGLDTTGLNQALDVSGVSVGLTDTGLGIGELGNGDNGGLGVLDMSGGMGVGDDDLMSGLMGDVGNDLFDMGDGMGF